MSITKTKLNSPAKLVTGIVEKGEKITTAKSNCRFIKGQYYVKNRGCYYAKDRNGNHKWYRYNSTPVGYNLDTETYELLSSLQEKAMYKVNYSKVSVTSYTSNIKYLIPVLSGSLPKNTAPTSLDNYLKNYKYSHKVEFYFNIDELNPEEVLYCKHNNIYYNKNCFEGWEEKAIQKFISGKQVVKYKFNLEYNITAAQEKALINHKKLDEVLIPYYDNSTKNAADAIPYTFGIEYETCNGTIPQEKLTECGLVPLMDGSLRKNNGFERIEPYEYTSIVMENIKGLAMVKRQTELLTEYCEVDSDCSLHFHFGGYPLDKKAIVALYVLLLSLQKEMFELVPEYKKSNRKYQNKTKDYNKSLLNLNITKYLKDNDIEQAFNSIFSFASDGQLSGENHKYNLQDVTNGHPVRGNKWDIGARYYWVNLVPLLFAKQRTVEFRIAHGTLNFTKVSCWLFLFNAILQYASVNSDYIVNNVEEHYSLDLIITEVYYSKRKADIADYLLNYIVEEKKRMLTYYKNKNYIPAEEFENDAEFSFTHKKIKSIY